MSSKSSVEVGADDRSLCGWRVRSQIALPDLPLWTGDDRKPDIVFEIGAVARPHASIADPSPKIGDDGVCRFNIEAVAAFAIEAGSRIVVDPRVDPNAVVVRQFLLGTGLGILCHQRNLVPLHASCVELNGQLVAFAGNSGAGKSTLAAALARAGHNVVGDDVCVLDLSGDAANVLPGASQIKLWRDSMAHLAMASDRQIRVRDGLEKYLIDDVVTPLTQASPLSAIYFLSESAQLNAPEIAVLRGAEKLDAVNYAIYRRPIGVNVRGSAAIFADTVRISSAVKGFSLLRAGGLGGLEALTQVVREHHRDGQ